MGCILALTKVNTTGFSISYSLLGHFQRCKNVLNSKLGSEYLFFCYTEAQSMLKGFPKIF